MTSVPTGSSKLDAQHDARRELRLHPSVRVAFERLEIEDVILELERRLARKPAAALLQIEVKIYLNPVARIKDIREFGLKTGRSGHQGR